jgi:hypothetical protein
VSDSGIIDWGRLDRLLPWVKYQHGYATYVYAFWLVDYGRNERDHGVALLKAEGRHPDWYLHAETADHVLAAYAPPKAFVSPNFEKVFGDKLQAKPLLGSLLLGTNNACYKRMDQMWWACEADLTYKGRRLLRRLDHLFERRHILVTFVEGPTDEASGPRGPAF